MLNKIKPRINVQNSKTQMKGFTLIELTMSMGILAVLLVAFTAIFGSVVDVNLESSSASAIDQDGRFVISRLVYDTQRADEIVQPSVPATTSSNTFTVLISGEQFTYGMDLNENIALTNNSGTNTLNSMNTKVENLTFQRIGIGDNTDTIQVKFNLVSRIQRTAGIVDSKDFQTTLSIR